MKRAVANVQKKDIPNGWSRYCKTTRSKTFGQISNFGYVLTNFAQANSHQPPTSVHSFNFCQFQLLMLCFPEISLNKKGLHPR